MTSNIQQMLINGFEQIGISHQSEQVEQLLTYLDLLEKWNAKYNLVADSDKESMVNRHLLDSLSILPYVTGEKIVDLGSGAGLPGIPLAIFNPQRHFILIDSNGKKTRFLFQVKIALNLNNVIIENCRVESYQCSHQIDMVTCRAFSALNDIVTKSKHLLSQECKLLAMKGRFPAQEIESLPEDFSVTKIVKLPVQGTDSERHLIEVIRH